MQLRFLGVHNSESRETRMSALLVDGVLAIDAGGLSRGLTLGEQDVLQAVLLTHRHFDHVRDVATVGMNTRGRSSTPLAALASVHDELVAKLLDGVLWSALYDKPEGAPSWRRVDVEPGVPLELAGYQITPLAMPHSVPAVGYVVAKAGASFFASGDAGPGLAQALLGHGLRPSLLMLECTYPNDGEAKALEQGHLTPALLAAELDQLQAGWGALPAVALVHRDPRAEAEMLAELDALQRRTAWSFHIPQPDDEITVS